MSNTTTSRRDEYVAAQAAREALAVQYARLAALLGEECPRNLRSWGTPNLRDGIARMSARLTTTPPAPVAAPSAPAPQQTPITVPTSKPADAKAGPAITPPAPSAGHVRVPAQQSTGRVVCYVHQETTAGLTYRPATAAEAMAYLLGTVSTVAEYDALMDTMAEQGQRRVDAIKGAAAPTAAKPAAQAPTANEPMMQAANTPPVKPAATRRPTSGLPCWPTWPRPAVMSTWPPSGASPRSAATCPTWRSWRSRPHPSPRRPPPLPSRLRRPPPWPS